ncbi:MAG: hypothetical protein WKF84_06845 [Pyrinomonadaceae bacterium]
MAIHLRNSDLNLLHLLLQQLQRKDLSADLRVPVQAAFFDVIEQRRSSWNTLAAELTEELEALATCDCRTCITSGSATEKMV